MPNHVAIVEVVTVVKSEAYGDGAGSDAGPWHTEPPAISHPNRCGAGAKVAHPNRGGEIAELVTYCRDFLDLIGLGSQLGSSGAEKSTIGTNAGDSYVFATLRRAISGCRALLYLDEIPNGADSLPHTSRRFIERLWRRDAPRSHKSARA